MERQVNDKDTQEDMQVVMQDTCEAPYVITKEDIRTTKKLAYQLSKLNESVKKFEEMATGGGIFSNLFG